MAKGTRPEQDSGIHDLDFGGLPRFLFSPGFTSPPSSSFSAAAAALVSGLGSLGGRPRPRFGGGSSVPDSAGAGLGLGGLPLFRFSLVSPELAPAVDVAVLDLFFDPLGRPLPRFTGAGGSSAGFSGAPASSSPVSPGCSAWGCSSSSSTSAAFATSSCSPESDMATVEARTAAGDEKKGKKEDKKWERVLLMGKTPFVPKGLRICSSCNSSRVHTCTKAGLLYLGNLGVEYNSPG